MALNANLVWEIRPGHGASTNGGAFDAVSGVPGTDYSQQHAPARTWINGAGGTGTLGNYEDDLASVNGSTVLTSASYNFTAADVGNIINITAGTNDIPGRYQIMSVAANQATLDRDCADAGDMSDATGYLGGAVGSLDTIYNVFVAGNTVYVAGGTGHNDAITTARTLTVGTFALPIRIVGYNLGTGDGAGTRTNLTSQTWAESHDDHGFLTLTGYPIISCSGILTVGAYTHFKCMDIQANGLASHIISSASTIYAWRVRIQNAVSSSAAITINGPCSMLDCEAICSGTDSNMVINTSSSVRLIYCRISGKRDGIVATSVEAVNTLFYGAGAAYSAIKNYSDTPPTIVINCTFYNCNRAIYNSSAIHTSSSTRVFNNVCIGATTFLQSATAAPFNSFNNRLLDNTTDYTGWQTGWASSFDTVGAGSYSTEFVDADNNDFRLKSTALARNAGMTPGENAGWLQRVEGAMFVIAPGRATS